MFDLRLSSRSFSLAFSLVVGSGFLSACTPVPADGGAPQNAVNEEAEDGKKAKKKDKKGKKDKKDKKDKKGKKAKGGTEKADAANSCCLYCVDGKPCGDKCVGTDEACSVSEAGCACEGSKRKPPKFKAGEKARRGLIAADVAAYNKAQGDLIDGLFTLEQAFAGDDKLADTSTGKLMAIIDTDLGKMTCELYEKEAPLTVANFVGLARGTRPVQDPKTKEWQTGVKYYDGILFHRVIKDFMLQTGDPTGTGTGGPNFFVPDEFDASLRHNAPGILSMANRNPVDPKTQKLYVDAETGQSLGNTGSSQFFITVAKTPHLDDRHTIFGKCDPKVAIKISKVDVTTNPALRLDHKPQKDVYMRSVTIERRK